MDVIIVIHTEFGNLNHRVISYNKDAIDGVSASVPNIIRIADKYNAKITFALMPEVIDYFPSDTKHEIGLHIHPGWQERNIDGIKQIVGDSYLKTCCGYSEGSIFLKDYSYKDQLEMMKVGKDCLSEKFGVEPKSFVAGCWSANPDTMRALAKVGITHDCSATPYSNLGCGSWIGLPRICMPYHPSIDDIQEKGDLPILIVPISQIFRIGNVNIELAPKIGLSWLKACFTEYYLQDLPIFHICLHSPCMVDQYYISALEKLIKFISKHKGINFKFASEIETYEESSPRTNILPYLTALNRNLIKSVIKSKIFL